MPTLDVTGTSLYYERTGDGPPLVFVHGMCGGAFVWADQVARLSDRFTCITYDRRGHSHSAPSDEQALDVHAEDLVALVDALDLDRPVLVGSSSGGAIVIETVVRFPRIAVGVVASEPAPLFDFQRAAAQPLLDTIVAAIGQPLAEGDPSAALVAFLAVVCPGLWEKMGNARRRAYLANGPMLPITLEAAGSTISDAQLAALDLPLCVITGANSVPAGRAVSELLIERLADVRHRELRGAGHATYVDAPDDFATVVATFAHEITTTSRSVTG